MVGLFYIILVSGGEKIASIISYFVRPYRAKLLVYYTVPLETPLYDRLFYTQGI